MATINPADDFDAETTAASLKTSMQGFGTDENVITKILSSHTNEQRQEISSAFKTSYGEDIVDQLKGELGGNYESAVIAMMTTPRRYDAMQLRSAMKGAGTDEATLVEIMCSRSNDDIELIKEEYQSEFDRVLEDDLMAETSGYFKRLLVSQCNAGRDESDDVNDDQAQEDAQAIYDAGEGQFGTDESVLNMVLCSRSYAQLNATFEKYQAIADNDIEEAIKSETSGTLQEGFLAIVRCAKDRCDFFAQRIKWSVAGAGTDDETLIRLIVSRSEIDLLRIMEAFEARYEKPMSEAIEGDCGGDYKRLLLMIIGAD